MFNSFQKLEGFIKTYLVRENFEGSGVPNKWADGGRPSAANFDYTADPLTGKQSLFLDATTSASDAIVKFGDRSEIWISFKLKFTGIGLSDFIYLLYLRDKGNVNVIRLFFYGNGTNVKFRLYNGTANGLGSQIVSNGTIYYLWLRVRKGDGTNGISELYVSTDGKRPASPDISLTAGSNTGTPNNVLFHAENTGRTITIDDVKAKITPIGDF